MAAAAAAAVPRVQAQAQGIGDALLAAPPRQRSARGRPGPGEGLLRTHAKLEVEQLRGSPSERLVCAARLRLDGLRWSSGVRRRRGVRRHNRCDSRALTRRVCLRGGPPVRDEVPAQQIGPGQAWLRLRRFADFEKKN
jgi:hypothetical protein